MKTEKLSSEEEEEDCYCIICLGAYSKSGIGQDQIECSLCKKCPRVGKSLFYICKNCTSDIDEELED